MKLQSVAQRRINGAHLVPQRTNEHVFGPTYNHTLLLDKGCTFTKQIIGGREVLFVHDSHGNTMPLSRLANACADKGICFHSPADVETWLASKSRVSVTKVGDTIAKICGRTATKRPILTIDFE